MIPSRPSLLAVSLGFLALLSATLRADETAERSAVLAADESRIAAMRNPTAESLGAIFSDQLHYAHSNGVIDTKESFVDILVSGKTKYLGYDHVERNVTLPAPGIALMSGQARIQAESAKGPMDSVLSYLAVWRKEDGTWKFLAWQSCRLPAEEPKP